MSMLRTLTVRGKVNPYRYSMGEERYGLCRLHHVRVRTDRRTVIEQYHQNPKKVFAMHNAVYPLSQEYQDIPRPDHSKDCDIPGPYHHAEGTGILCEAASLVLQRTRNIPLLMAGSGDMMDAMINLAGRAGHRRPVSLPGFMKGKSGI